MEVSMDGLRNQLVRNYNSLVRKLNSNIKDESWDPHMEGEHGWKSMDDDTKFVLFNPQEGEED